MLYSAPDEVVGILQLPPRAAGPWGQVGDRLRALEGAVALAQGHAVALG